MSATNGGALGFLTSGTTPGQSQQESESASSLPSWYTDYTQQILNSAAQWGAAGYQAYQGPQVAAQSDLTNDAAQQSQGVAGGAAAGTQAASNLINQGVGTVNSAIAPGQGGLSAAQPYLNSAATPTSQTVNDYMNPYNQNVTDAIASAGASNFQNNILPALQSGITGAGNITGASTEGAQLENNAALTNQQATSQAQSAALQAGYTGSLGAATNEAQIQAGLGSTAGSLGTAQQNAIENAGTATTNAGVAQGNVGALGTQQQISAEGNENTFGNQQQGEVQANENAALSNFQAQNNFPLTAASAMQGALSGVQVPTTTTNYGASTGTPSTIGNSPITTAGAALSGLAANSGSTGALSTPTPVYNPTTGTYGS
jgi:hypothetical protein